MSEHYVYILFRLDGRPFYVGCGKGDRWNFHEWEARNGSSNNRYKMHIIQQIISARKDVPKIKLAENLTIDEARSIEIAFIAAIGRMPNGPLINLTDGGEGIVGLSKESRECGAAKKRGRKASPETIEKMRLSHLGKALSESHRLALSRAGRGKKKHPGFSEKLRQANLGKIIPPEVRAKISATMTGRPAPPGRIKLLAQVNTGRRRSFITRARISTGRKGIKMSAESRALMSKNNGVKTPETRIRMSEAKRLMLRYVAIDRRHFTPIHCIEEAIVEYGSASC